MVGDFVSVSCYETKLVYMLSSKNKPYPFRQLFYAVGSNQILVVTHYICTSNVGS